MKVKYIKLHYIYDISNERFNIVNIETSKSKHGGHNTQFIHQSSIEIVYSYRPQTSLALDHPLRHFDSAEYKK